MSVNSPKQTYKQPMDWLEWFNRKYNRSTNNFSKPNNPKKYNK